MNVILKTGRTVWQGQAIESGKDLKMYVDAAAICHMNREMMDEMGLKEGNNIQVVSNFGDVVVKVVNTNETLPDASRKQKQPPRAPRRIASGASWYARTR